ncbi:ATP-binding cassette domain-containing protein [Mycoplasma sp. P36-A1]|uniref:ATP-binding cassette domain-containing protein n=1 Tax=Mycoplasma sp. P36-A1 TaxID=3252900 RepID=UPI003C2F98EE
MKNETTLNEMLNLNELFNLTPFIEKKYAQLSLGNKQKMLIIQALIDNSSILILDEPFNSLDTQTSEILKEYLIQFKKKGILIISSHYKNDIEEISDVLIQIENGGIINWEKTFQK